MTTRRHFVLTVPAAALALIATRVASAQAIRLEETDSIALSLGYRHDASKVDTKGFRPSPPAANCANCQLYQSKAGDAWGACPGGPWAASS